MQGLSFWGNGAGVTLWKQTHVERYVPMALE